MFSFFYPNRFIDNCLLNIGILAKEYILRINQRNTRKRCEICSKLTIKMPERRQWRCSGVFVDFELVNICQDSASTEKNAKQKTFLFGEGLSSAT